MKDDEFKKLIQEFRKACKRPTSQIKRMNVSLMNKNCIIIKL